MEGLTTFILRWVGADVSELGLRLESSEASPQHWAWRGRHLTTASEGGRLTILGHLPPLSGVSLVKAQPEFGQTDAASGKSGDSP